MSRTSCVLRKDFNATAAHNITGAHAATAAHNAALPALLLPSQHNYAQAYESIPSFSDPFIFAYVAALLAQPSVDFRISSSKNTSLVWSWGEAHAAFLEEELPSGSLCPKGKKTMRAYSKPFDLSRYAPERWVTAKSIDWLADPLDASPHSPVAPALAIRDLRPATAIETEMMEATEW